MDSEFGPEEIVGGITTTTASGLTYPIVDTSQFIFYNNSQAITPPTPGGDFYGQDAMCAGYQENYTLSADGKTVYDNVTELTWMQSPDTNMDGTVTYSDKLTYTQACALPATLNAANYGGYSDWRLPTVKELFSLINFNGVEPSPTATSDAGAEPYISTDYGGRTGYFEFAYGFTTEDADLTGTNERIIDSQWATTTLYVANTDQMFGVNFADGRIKAYPASASIGKKFCVSLVRGNENYGVNQFADNGDGTVTDSATGLMWSQDDSGAGKNWQEALAWVQTKNSENYLGHDDWRLPNAKELQSIVDYTRSPDTTISAAIDPLFTCTQITNEKGVADYPFYWTGTTHLSTHPENSASAGVYVAFGRALGYMDPDGPGPASGSWVDVHGAGCQRSEFKQGNPADYPNGFGPQGDAIRIYNHVRLVRDVAINDDPVADAGVNQAVSAGSVVTFDGSGSADNIDIVNYSWNFTYNGTAFTLYDIAPEFTFCVAGNYTVTLTVRDAAGNPDSDTMLVRVSALPITTDTTLPVANTGPNQAITAGALVTFNGSASTDDVGITNYTWTFTYNGTVIALYGVSPSFRFWTAGNYTVTLTVRDVAGNTDTNTLVIRVMDSSGGTSWDGSPGSYWWIILIIVVVVILALLLVKGVKTLKTRGK
ncbi:MAG: DUF1566 domain-containing protein [Euryarchaeota archaeon]|nr:DUF1566 domain-containing protein [Euryarchaeota archaeon]